MSTKRKFKPQVRSRHGSHANIKKDGMLKLFPKKSVVRLGSFTEFPDDQSKGGKRIEINTVEAIHNSACKLRMKTKFTEAGVITAPWFTYSNGIFLNENDEEKGFTINELPFPIVSKHIRGSRGIGNIKHDTIESFEQWFDKKNALNATSNYIFEQYKNLVREYRLHVTKNGCFYTCRKMLRQNTPVDKRWFRNDSNSVWILETNESFDKPINWDDIVAESIKALNAVGLDIGAVDVKVQSSTDKKGEIRTSPEFFIIEINSAPSFGEITEEKYIEEINTLIESKL